MTSSTAPTSEPAEVIFAEGMVGLPSLTRHKLAQVPDSELFELLSVDEPAMGFIAARADDVRPGMTAALREHDMVAESEVVLVLLAVHGDPPVVTANLAGPIALDTGRGTGRQLVLEDPAYPLRLPVYGH